MLQIGFDDQSEQRIDFRPVLAGELYAPLRDLEVFNQVALDRGSHARLAKWGGFRSGHSARLASTRRSNDREGKAVGTCSCWQVIKIVIDTVIRPFRAMI